MDFSFLLLLLLSRLRLLFLSLSFLVMSHRFSFLAVPRQAGEDWAEVMVMVSFVSFAFQQTAVSLGADLAPITGCQVDEAGCADQGCKEGGRGDEVLDR